jgi:chromosome segregation ATPase
LQEHDGCEGNVDSSIKLLELREKLAAREEEIDRMNEEFSFEIEKYNTVYEAMKREIEELKDLNSTDLYEMVERLETEIVKMREEKERDEIIIRELKDRVPSYPTGSHVRRPNTYSRVYY